MNNLYWIKISIWSKRFDGFIKTDYTTKCKDT